MVPDKLIVIFLIVAILLSVFSIVMTISLNLKFNALQQSPIEGNNQGNVQLTVAPNPLAGPSGDSP